MAVVVFVVGVDVVFVSVIVVGVIVLIVSSYLKEMSVSIQLKRTEYDGTSRNEM